MDKELRSTVFCDTCMWEVIIFPQVSSYAPVNLMYATIIPQGYHLVKTERPEYLEAYVNVFYEHLSNFTTANTADLSNNEVIEWVVEFENLSQERYIIPPQVRSQHMIQTKTFRWPGSIFSQPADVLPQHSVKF